MQQHAASMKLKRVDMHELVIHKSGREWIQAALNLFCYKIESNYGNIPLPETVIEDDLTLCFFWDCHGDPVFVRLDNTMWDYAKEPLEK